MTVLEAYGRSSPLKHNCPASLTKHDPCPWQPGGACALSELAYLWQTDQGPLCNGLFMPTMSDRMMAL